MIWDTGYIIWMKCIQVVSLWAKTNKTLAEMGLLIPIDVEYQQNVFLLCSSHYSTYFQKWHNRGSGHVQVMLGMQITYINGEFWALFWSVIEVFYARFTLPWHVWRFWYGFCRCKLFKHHITPKSCCRSCWGHVEVMLAEYHGSKMKICAVVF